ncbi:MAG: DUF3570 domain-containing protein [Candidatus Zixiibacteriota bacterium]
MNKTKSIRSALSALTAALVGTGVTPAQAQNHSETSILIYSERDRIRATEGNFSLTKQLRNNYTLGLRLTYDGLTGATPTGGSPSKNPQTLTRASGGKTVVVPAGEFPVDRSFKDTRFAADASLAKPVGRLSNATLGLRLSSENDYTSAALSAGITRDLNQKNTTIGLSAAFAHDVSKPVGGFHPEFSVVGEDIEDDEGIDRLQRFEGKQRNVYDAVLSLTQVLDRNTLLMLNLSLNTASGYLTDPYKIISLVEPPESENAGEPVENIHERRPANRSKRALYAELKRYLGGSTVGLSYRYFWDDWGVRSHSVDAAYRIDFNRRGAFEPRIRWYHQSQASFFHPFLVQGAPLPAYASSDSRLASFDALTYGLNYSVPVNAGSRVNITAEYYTQRGDRSPPGAFGSLLSFELFPKLDVIMLRLGYSRDF